MTQDARHHAVVDDRQSPPRDLCDMAGTAAEIALDIEWAGKRLGCAFENGNVTDRAAGFRELFQARLALDALISEIETLCKIAEPIGGEG